MGDRSEGKIYTQSLSSSLSQRIDDVTELLHIAGAQIGAVSVDWATGNVFFTELSAPFIGRTLFWLKIIKIILF